MAASSEASSPAVQWVGLLLGPLLALAAWWALGGAAEVAPGAARVAAQPAMAGVAVLMAVWWMTEALPLAATALVPLALYPWLRIMTAREVAPLYGDDLVFLYLGGMLLALGVEDSGLHRRAALAIVARVGSSPRRIVLGFMLATALLSMWMSNTAVTLLVYPIALSVLVRVEAAGADARRQRRFGAALMLGVAYAASIGGFATLVGTPTNVAFKQAFETRFPDAPEISFGGWMLLAAPLSVTFLFVAWAWLAFVAFPLGRQPLLGGQDAIRREQAELGPISAAEVRMALLFALTAAAWIFREPLPGWGWAPAAGVGRGPAGEAAPVSDTTVALGMALVAFLLPRRGWGGPRLVTWQSTARLPWGVLLLFGGGLALAVGMQQTGLDQTSGEWLARLLEGRSSLVASTGVALFITALSELVANLSAVQITMPVLANVAQQLHIDPRLLMVTGTIAASFGFMLPVATPPNTIIFASGRVEIRDMLKAGLALDLLGSLLAVAFVYYWGAPTLGILLSGAPDWAQ